jgi:hypothetical protein
MLMFPSNPLVDSIHQSTKGFYNGLWDSVFCETFPVSQANFYNAYELYHYAAYRWNYDDKTRSVLTADDLNQLRELAWHEQVLKHADIAGSDTQDDMTSAIAGRTLASRVTALFSDNIESCGERNKLNLAFTSHEPFLAFFALAGLDTGELSHLFSRLPEPGATLTFELFSIDHDTDSHRNADSCDHHSCNDDDSDDDSCNCDYCYDDEAHPYRPKSRRSDNDGSVTPYDNENAGTYHELPLYQVPVSDESSCPSPDNIFVRFLYRNSTSSFSNPSNCSPLVPIPLFGNTQSSIPFKHFKDIMGKIGIPDATKWCSVCESDAFFCQGAEPRKKHHRLLAIFLSSAGTLLAVSIVIFIVTLTF